MTPADEENRGEREGARPDDTRSLKADARDADADAREATADERSANADMREAIADRRSSSADMRELVVDARGAEADSREAEADARQAAAEARDSAADARDAADARKRVPNARHPDAAGGAGAGKSRIGAPQIVVIDTESWSACTICGESVGRGSDHAVMHDFEQRVNHLLSEHDATLQHVGQRTGRSSEGDLFHHVVAVLGLPH